MSVVLLCMCVPHESSQAIDILLKAGAKTVIITSIEVGSNTLVLLGGTQEGV